MAKTTINYEDPRITENKKEEEAALKESDTLYDGMISESDEHYKGLIDAAEDYGDTQAKNQQERTDFAIEQIDQQKDQAKKDYTKEQAGAYVDWQKASDPYGVNAEKVAASGLSNSGYADSLETQKYVAYQNRVATARETYNKAVLEYDNMIKEAKLQNNAILAEIAYNTLQTKLSLSLEGFQYENSLIIEKANKRTEIKNNYYARYSDIVDQINTENALAEQKRQFDSQLKEEKRQFNETMAFNKEKSKEDTRQFNETLAYNKSKDSSSGSSKISGSKSASGGSAKIGKNSGSGWDNGSVSTSDIKTLQKALGVTADGKWGPKSTSAAGGLTADEAWKAYKSGKLNKGDDTQIINTTVNNELTEDGYKKFTSYSEAVKCLQHFGKTKGDGGLMTESEWRKRKSGGGKSWTFQFNSYSDYLTAFVAWRMENPE